MDRVAHRLLQGAGVLAMAYFFSYLLLTTLEFKLSWTLTNSSNIVRRWRNTTSGVSQEHLSVGSNCLKPIRAIYAFRRKLLMQTIVRARPSSSGNPEFYPKSCTSCGATIRGTYFHCHYDCNPSESSKRGSPGCESKIDHDQKRCNIERSPRSILCETCARSNAHPAAHLRKVEKHCALNELEGAISTQAICQCEIPCPSFPIPLDELERHTADCGLLNLKRDHTAAKLADLLQHKHSSAIGASPKNDSTTDKILLPLMRPVIRTLVENIPFGNIHMALRLGPLIIENGVPK